MLLFTTPTDKRAAWRRTHKILVLTLTLLGLTLALPTVAPASILRGNDVRSAQSPANVGYLVAVDFTEASHGWAVGDRGIILATTNGGATWSAQSSGTNEQLNGVAFPDAAHGWAVARNGTILATTSGGE